MDRTAVHRLERSLAIAITALLAACGDEAPFGLDQRPAVAAPQATVGLDRAPDLGSCNILEVPAKSKVVFHVYAKGTQIYSWNGASWSFVAPSALLYADAGYAGVVGTHYAGPTWESNSGSKVVGAVLQRCTPDPNAIPWLLLGVVSAEGPGIFARTTFIHRVNTVGGNPPAAPGSFIGELRSVPYTTEYFFYRS
jgi:hypothetical protein